MSIHQFSAVMIDGKERVLSEYEGNPLLIVNTASKCGFTPQFAELQALYEKYEQAGLKVLGFPSNQFMNQDPGSNEEIQAFCKKSYGVTFPMFEKVNVKGKDIHPIFQYLTEQSKGFLTGGIKWNFTKFLIDANGQVVQRYAPSVKPSEIEKEIKQLLPIDEGLKKP